VAELSAEIPVMEAFEPLKSTHLWEAISEPVVTSSSTYHGGVVPGPVPISASRSPMVSVIEIASSMNPMTAKSNVTIPLAMSKRSTDVLPPVSRSRKTAEAAGAPVAET
jgi:hypothetical protein